MLTAHEVPLTLWTMFDQSKGAFVGVHVSAHNSMNFVLMIVHHWPQNIFTVILLIQVSGKITAASVASRRS